jgi:hypothetical protein
VRAVNSAGEGAEAEVTKTPAAAAPAAPQFFAASPGDTRVTLTWAAPSDDGGSAITKYEVWCSKDGEWVDGSGSGPMYIFTNLTTGTTYTFKVRAVNSAGNGAEATTTATPEVPSTPTYAVTLTGGTGYTLTAKAGSASPVEEGSDFTFVLKLTSGYEHSTPTVKINSGSAVTLTNVDATTYEYTITGINAAQTVTVENVNANIFGGTVASGTTNFTITSITTAGESVVTGNYTIPSTLGIYTVTGINPYAFRSTTATGLTIPATVTTISAGGFGGSIATLTVNASNTTYGSTNNYIYKKPTTATLTNGCKSSTNFTGVTGIAAGAFKYCNQMTSITLPSTITTIGNDTFTSCTKLESITFYFMGTGTSSKRLAYFFGTIEDSTNPSLPASLTTITIQNLGSSGKLATGAFEGCRYIKTVNFPQSIIPEKAFSGCTALENYNSTISSPVGSYASVGQYAFQNCTNLKSVAFANGETDITIEGGAFKNSGITAVDTRIFAKIAQGAFEGCNSLVRMDVKEILYWNAGSANMYPFSYFFKPFVIGTPNATKADNATVVPQSLVTVVYYGGYTYPDANANGGAFEGCKYIKTLVFTSSGNHDQFPETGFANMTALETLVLPLANTNAAIQNTNSAFEGTVNLKTVYYWGNQTNFNLMFLAGCTTMHDPNVTVYVQGQWSLGTDGLPKPN